MAALEIVRVFVEELEGNDIDGGSWGPATISALAAIFGSLSGALVSSASTRITHNHQGRRDLPC